jgi:hypothetical protein
MTRISFRPFPTRVRLDRVLTTSALALVLTTLPIDIDAGAPALHWQAAFAKSDGGGGGGGAGGGGGGQGGGGGLGGDHGKGPGERGGPDGVPGSRGHAYGRDAAQGGAGGGPGYHDLDEFLDSVRNGKALGLERRDERLEQAQGRYAAALGKADRARPDDGAVGAVAHRFSAEETEALMARGWKGPAGRDAGFRNHGERVSTMVELSKRLGYGARAAAGEWHRGAGGRAGRGRGRRRSRRG